LRAGSDWAEGNSQSKAERGRSERREGGGPAATKSRPAYLLRLSPRRMVSWKEGEEIRIGKFQSDDARSQNIAGPVELLPKDPPTQGWSKGSEKKTGSSLGDSFRKVAGEKKN